MNAILMAVPGFHGPQTPLDPAGPQALQIEHTLFLIFWITSIVTAIVFAVLASGDRGNMPKVRCRLHSRLIPAPNDGRHGRWAVEQRWHYCRSCYSS